MNQNIKIQYKIICYEDRYLNHKFNIFKADTDIQYG
jgi:hypothetical protein